MVLSRSLGSKVSKVSQTQSSDFFHQTEHFDTIKNHDIPVICINSVYAQNSEPVIRTDNLAVGRCAADFFLGQEVVDLCFVSDACDHYYSKAREQGFVDQLSAHQRVAHTLNAEHLEDALPWIEKQLAKKRKTGIFCVNDACARALLNKLEPLYPNVDQLLTLLGADNDPFYYENGQTVFSSIEIDHRNVGYQALRELHQNFTLDSLIPKTTEIPPYWSRRQKPTAPLPSLCAESASLHHQALRQA